MNLRWILIPKMESQWLTSFQSPLWFMKWIINIHGDPSYIHIWGDTPVVPPYFQYGHYAKLVGKGESLFSSHSQFAKFWAAVISELSCRSVCVPGVCYHSWAAVGARGVLADSPSPAARGVVPLTRYAGGGHIRGSSLGLRPSSSAGFEFQVRYPHSGCAYPWTSPLWPTQPKLRIMQSSIRT